MNHISSLLQCNPTAVFAHKTVYLFYNFHCSVHEHPASYLSLYTPTTPPTHSFSAKPHPKCIRIKLLVWGSKYTE